ncbi:hypothetical protein [Deinococcus marmoris]|uniref:hypothetical protein n=1 Tax=Deinococcus marmoris TaxID=249408 RepID=UPI0004976AF9|nr:hypothetical protein [Deinococcus marmoris]
MIQNPSLPFAVDYAVRYTAVFASFDDFMTPIREHLHALSYSPPGPAHGVPGPSLAFIFDAQKAAEEVFAIFQKWVGGQETGVAIGLSLVARVTGDYVLCVYPDAVQLQARFAPGPLAAHLNTQVVTPAHIKTFPGPSQNLAAFRDAAQDQTVAILPGLKDGALAPGLAIIGVPVRFLEEAELNPSGFEYALLHGVEPSRSPAEPDDHRPEILTRRRQTLLSRYFPVTLERLRFNTAFQGDLRQLADEGYADWQVQQAACNLTLPERLGDLPADQRDAVSVLIELENSPEELSQPEPRWNLESLRTQLERDVRELIGWLAPERAEASLAECQEWLRQRGDLGECT